jgi:leader peptidase (prepilin peptidase) / N-methyltransferase
MSLDPIAGLGCALVTAALCAAGPAVLRRLRQPATAPAASRGALADAEADVPGAPTSKVTYRDLAARPRLSWRLSATGAAVGAVVGAGLGAVPALVPWTYLAAVGVLLAYVDVQIHLLPTRIIAPSYAVVICLIALAALLDGSLAGLERAGLAWLVMGGFYFALWFVHPSGIGYGDVRLAGLLALTLGYLGWGQLVTGMYAGFLLGGLGGAALALARRADRRRFPFGPFMVLGALGGAAFGGVLADLYTAW